MALDCYVTTCASGPLRTALAMATLHGLLPDPSLSVVLLRSKACELQLTHPQLRSAWALDCTNEEFQKKRRTEAAARSLTAWYVMADDDVLPLSDNWVMLGLAIAQKHPEFGILGLRERGASYLPYEGYKDDDIEERDEAGRIYFMRRGILGEREWPAVHEENDYDKRLAAALRRKRLKVGIFNKLLFNHLGVGFSTATHNANQT